MPRVFGPEREIEGRNEEDPIQSWPSGGITDVDNFVGW